MAEPLPVEGTDGPIERAVGRIVDEVKKIDATQHDRVPLHVETARRTGKAQGLALAVRILREEQARG